MRSAEVCRLPWWYVKDQDEAIPLQLSTDFSQLDLSVGLSHLWITDFWFVALLSNRHIGTWISTGSTYALSPWPLLILNLSPPSTYHHLPSCPYECQHHVIANPSYLYDLLPVYYDCNTHLQWPLWQWIWLRAATNVTTGAVCCATTGGGCARVESEKVASPRVGHGWSPKNFVVQEGMA